MKNLIESIRQRYQPQSEATMMKDDGKMVHNCAKHVEHAEWGKGNTIAEEHADPDRHGNIAWYDIVFEHGIEKGVPISELKVLQAETHVHTTKKAKKMAEGNDGNLANNAKPYDKVTHGDVISGRLGKDEMGGKKKKAEVKEGADQPHKIKGDPYATHIGSHGDEHVYYGGDSGSDEHVYHIHNSKTGKTDTHALYHEGTPWSKSKITKFAGKEIGGILHKHHVDNIHEEVDEIVIHADRRYELDEAQKSGNYDAHFKAHMKKRGIKHPGELDTPEKKKEFFNAVDASYKAKNEEVFVEAYMSSDIQDVMAAHKKAGNRISNETSGTRDGKPHHSFVVTTPEGKRTRHIYHGSTKKLETMSPAAKSKESSEQDLDDK